MCATNVRACSALAYTMVTILIARMGRVLRAVHRCLAEDAALWYRTQRHRSELGTTTRHRDVVDDIPQTQHEHAARACAHKIRAVFVVRGCVLIKNV